MKYYDILGAPVVMYPVGNYLSHTLHYMHAVMSIINTKEYGIVKAIKAKEEVILWARGSSGCIISTLFARELVANDIVKDYNKIKIQYVRKDKEVTHGSGGGIGGKERYSKAFNVIIDDIISTGETIRAITVQAIREGVGYFDLIIAGDGGYELLLDGSIPIPKIMLNTYEAYELPVAPLKKLKFTNLQKYVD